MRKKTSPAPVSLLKEKLKAAKGEKKLYAAALAGINRQFGEKVKELSILRRIGDSISSSLDERTVTESLVNILISEMTAENCSIMLFSEDRTTLLLRAAQGQADVAPRYYTPEEGMRMGGLATGEGVAGWVARTGKPLLISNTALNRRFKRKAGGLKGITSLLCMPIKGDEGVVGVLNLSHPDIGKFSEENKRLLRLIVNQAALAINNIRLFSRIRKFNEELENRIADRTRQLSDSERKYKSLMKQGADGIIVLAPRTGTVLECNDSMGKLLGVKPEKILGKRFGTFCRVGNITLEQRLRKLEKSRKKQATFDCRLKCGGECNVVRPVTISAAIVKLVEGDVAHFTVHDLTQRVMLEEKLKNYSLDLEVQVKKRTSQLRQTQEELSRAAKLAALGELASGVAHEINNPVAIISGYAEDLKDRIMNGEDLGKHTLLGTLNMMIQSAERCHSITREILDFSKQQPNRIEAHRIREILETAASMVSSRAVDRKVAICLPGDQDFELETDKNHLIQVLINLLSNAIDASERQSSVEVGASCVNGNAVISVTDHGHGIPKKILPKIFDPFFSTKPSGKGTGLGLSISYQIIKKLNGSVRVQSVPGKTTFTVTMPAKNREEGKGDG